MESTVPTFEEWVAHCFDHPVGGPEWYFEIDAPVCEPPNSTLLEYLTRLFSAPIEHIGHYSDAQLNQGLWYMASASCSNTMFCLVDSEISESKRVACISAMSGLYKELFALRCTNTTSNGNSNAAEISELNGICYMWWDVMPIFGKPEEPARAGVDNAILELLESTLHSTSRACQESALHGLGHWAPYYPVRVESLIKSFLSSPSVIEPLRSYAVAASKGDVQ